MSPRCMMEWYTSTPLTLAYPKPSFCMVMSPVTDRFDVVVVPVSVGVSAMAFASEAVCSTIHKSDSSCCVAADSGFDASDVLSTLPSPTMALVIPDTVPVKVGLLVGALVLSAVRSPLVLMVMVELWGSDTKSPSGVV